VVERGGDGVPTKQSSKALFDRSRSSSAKSTLSSLFSLSLSRAYFLSRFDVNADSQREKNRKKRARRQRKKEQNSSPEHHACRI